MSKKILPNDKQLEYCGRIDFTEENAPKFIYPCSYVKIRFFGTKICTEISNLREYWDNYLGVIIDGVQSKIRLEDDAKLQKIVLAEGLEEKEHELMLFKRQDACHIFRFYGFEIEGEVLSCLPKPSRRIEVYGDSVSAGEVSEAVAYVGKTDPEHQGEFSNSWYSYAWMTARTLDAQIHDIAQGGIALMNNTGWYHQPDTVGMESVYDKMQYNSLFGTVTRWDFAKYRPHVVIVAIGQNDNHPNDYMKEDYYGAKAKTWRAYYKTFAQKLREIYPKAEIVFTTTILEHDENWDKAIESVCQELSDAKMHHFMYSLNGKGTPGHIRIREAEQMAKELSEYILSLGEEIWKEEDER